MKKNVKRAIIITIGVAFVILGLVGLVLPFLQGILFLVIGLLLLSAFSPTLREWMQKHTRKYPKLHHWVLKAEGWIEQVIGKPE